MTSLEIANFYKAYCNTVVLLKSNTPDYIADTFPFTMIYGTDQVKITKSSITYLPDMVFDTDESTTKAADWYSITWYNGKIALSHGVDDPYSLVNQKKFGIYDGVALALPYNKNLLTK